MRTGSYCENGMPDIGNRKHHDDRKVGYELKVSGCMRVPSCVRGLRERVGVGYAHPVHHMGVGEEINAGEISCEKD